MNKEVNDQMNAYVSSVRSKVFPVVKKLAEGVQVDYQTLGGIIMELSTPYFNQEQRIELMELNKKAMAEYIKTKEK